MKTNRLRLRNHGAVVHQTTLTVAAPAGSGAAQLVDGVYTVGQSTSTRYITVADETGFAVGMYITIHAMNIGSAGDPAGERRHPGNPPDRGDRHGQQPAGP